MKISILSAKVIDTASPYHLKTCSVLIHNGKIAHISALEEDTKAEKTIRGNGMLLTTGWVDLGAWIGDPGQETRETLASANACAAAGGFTEVTVLPNTSPPVQSKSDILYLTRGNTSRLVQIHPMGAVTKQCQGEQLAEMMDMANAGALAFTDGLASLWHTDIFIKALQYLQPLKTVLIDHPQDIHIGKFGQMHEGAVSTSVGLKGIPPLAEEISVSRNLDLLRYADGRLHFSKLSSPRSVEMIAAARKSGLKVTCDTTSYQALLDDSLLASLDANYKVAPPLREKQQNDQLLKLLKDHIEVLCSGHMPCDLEGKLIEFEQANFGIINWQTFGAQLVALSKWIDWETLIKKVTTNPRQILGLPQPTIDVGQPANLTLFDLKKTWILNEETNLSLSSNSPYFGKEIKGKVAAIFNNGKYFIY